MSIKMNHNKKRSQVRKARRLEQLQHQKDEELYYLAKLDPETIEGQSRLPIEQISPETKVSNKGFLSQILRFW